MYLDWRPLIMAISVANLVLVADDAVVVDVVVGVLWKKDPKMVVVDC